MKNLNQLLAKTQWRADSSIIVSDVKDVKELKKIYKCWLGTACNMKPASITNILEMRYKKTAF